jgi:hypothetical protein
MSNILSQVVSLNVGVQVISEFVPEHNTHVVDFPIIGMLLTGAEASCKLQVAVA